VLGGCPPDVRSRSGTATVATRPLDYVRMLLGFLLALILIQVECFHYDVILVLNGLERADLALSKRIYE